MKFTSQTAREAGRKGGLTTVKRHGRAHMAVIGRKGFHALVRKHYGGDYRLCLNTLISRGLMTQDPNPENNAWTKHRIGHWLPTHYRPPQEDQYGTDQ